MWKVREREHAMIVVSREEQVLLLPGQTLETSWTEPSGATIQSESSARDHGY